jgi:hypothetical protein
VTIDSTCTRVHMNGNDGGEHGWLFGEFHVSWVVFRGEGRDS